jgi:hypothetical protein
MDLTCDYVTMSIMAEWYEDDGGTPVVQEVVDVREKTIGRNAPGKVRTVTTLTIITVLLFIFAGPGLFVIGPFAARAAMIRLLCKTDHKALLEAGREVLSQVHIEPTPDGIRTLGAFPVPGQVKIPKAIRRLRPRGVLVSYDGYLIIMMSSAMDHFGVRIYPEGFQPPEPGFRYGDRKLLDGLWYYDEAYRHNPRFDEQIEALLRKAGKLHGGN